MSCGRKQEPIGIGLPSTCCTGTTGCSFDGNLRRVKAEPVYVQKVYDTALFNLQGLRTVADQPLTPNVGRNARITRILDIRCKKFFNPNNINDPRNLTVDQDTTLSGAQFVKDGKGNDVTVVGPDGLRSEKLVYADTQACDEECKGTPIFGTQTLSVTGNVLVEIDAIVSDDCEKKCKVTLTGNIPIGSLNNPLVLTNFFELCIPSVQDGSFLPRFTELCNVDCEPRLATNNISRDIRVDNAGNATANLMVSICITCEKKIVVPVQLCVLSTGFPQLSPEVAPICESFPSLFPNQIDEESVRDCLRERERESEDDRRCHPRNKRNFILSEESDVDNIADIADDFKDEQ